MTTELAPTLESINELAAFNRWAGFEVMLAGPGLVELRVPLRAELGQYTGFLHAGLISALVDTACGFAAFTVTGGPVLASSCGVRFFAPATGEAFVARARVDRSGRRQVFTSAEVFAEREGVRHLVACGETLLVPTGKMSP